MFQVCLDAASWTKFFCQLWHLNPPGFSGLQGRIGVFAATWSTPWPFSIPQSENEHYVSWVKHLSPQSLLPRLITDRGMIPQVKGVSLGTITVQQILKAMTLAGPDHHLHRSH